MLIPGVQRMGLRHFEYGEKDEHYATVGAALWYALEQGLGYHFTESVREAWTAVYGKLAEVMLEAAGQASYNQRFDQG
ncbi:MAG: globin domain-containing protein [Meiothermus sp.]|nr:globin domain-containing protein [Meiothermus sp.]